MKSLTGLNLMFFAALLFAATGTISALECVVFPIDTDKYGSSGYTALQVCPEGMVYVGTARYGGSAYLIRLDPETGEWDKIFDAHSITREPVTALGAQGKIHAGTAPG